MSESKRIKEQIIKDTASYNFAQYSSQFLGFFSAIAMRNFLGPYLMGIWSILRVILDYATFANLGVEAAAGYQIPFLKGKGDKKGQEETKDCAFGFLFWTSLMCGIAILIAAFMLRHRYSAEIISGLAIISVYLILQRISSYYMAVLRANVNFYVINRVVVFDAIVNLALILLLVRNFKLNGLYISVILMALLDTSLMHLLARYTIRLAFDLKRVYFLLRVGFPLLLFGVLTTVLGSIDKIMIARMMGVTFVGYYSIANMAQNYLYGATNNFSIVAMPKLLEAYGKQQDLKQVKKFVTVSAEVVSYLLPSLLGAIFLITPLFIAKVLPKFIPGIAAMQVLLLDIFFRSCSPQASHFLVALGKQLGLIPITAAAIALSIFFNFIFIRSGLGIAGAALGVSLSSLFATVLTLIYAMKQFANFKEIAAFILKIIFPLAYICTVVLSSYYFINISNPYIRLAVNLLILSAASLPLFFYIDRRTHVVRSIINLLKVKSKIEDAG